MTGTNGTNGHGTNGASKGFDPSLITKPGDAGAVPGLVKEIATLSQGFESDDAQRLSLKAKVYDLLRAVETPRERMIRDCWSEPGSHCALTAGETKGIWKYLVEHEGDGPFNAAEVAKVKGIDPPMLCRMMKHLAATGYINEVGLDTYTLTNHTRAMSIPIIGECYPCMAGGCFNSLSKFSEWAEKNDWKTPAGIAGGPLQMAYNTELNFFAHLQANPPYGEQFNSLMGGYHQGRASWMDSNFYPVKERLFDGFDTADKDAAMIVDIGGNMGHDLAEFHRKHPDVPGRLVLQDLPVIIGQIKSLDEKVERMEYDFYTEQPVKGSRVYFMHSILHDWTDEICLKILANVTAAMKPGYSKLLINENVIPDTGADWEQTCLDMMMLTLLSSKERTRGDWQDLLGKAGLKIVQIWTVAKNAESLIECELA
jgi:hypothetical protein